jgi:hypothetical protein
MMNFNQEAEVASSQHQEANEANALSQHQGVDDQEVQNSMY